MIHLEKIILEIEIYEQNLVTQALESGLNQFYTVDPSVATQIRDLGAVVIISPNPDTQPDLLIGKDISNVRISSKQDESLALDTSAHIVLIETTDWRIIPLENIIADLEETNKQLIVHARNIDDAELLLGTLERGVNAIILPLDDSINIKDLVHRLKDRDTLLLPPMQIEGIQNVGMGDRVCVDTCSILNLGEGLLVGSQSNGLFLIHNENVVSPYADPRPFRVNAGAVHSYVLLPSGKTQYLMEIQGGSRVLVCDSNGQTRSVAVGRSKIEKRPLVLVSAVPYQQQQKRTFQVIVQNAETIRFVRADQTKSLISVARIKPGDLILGYVQEGGRHFGKKITESIEER